jgi:hypothetical protein
VKLLDHPLMVRKSGIVSWPPEWKAVSDCRQNVQGEVGTLEEVSMHDLIANKIFLAIEYRSERYIAVLAFDDEMFAKQLYPLLADNIGRSIREIGDLDLSHLL